MDGNKYKIDEELFSSFTKEADRKAKLSWKQTLDMLVNIELGRSKREAKGLKPNKITKDEMLQVLEFWLDNNCSNISLAFREVFSRSDKVNKEDDWPKAMPSSRGFKHQFKDAVLLSTHPKMLTIRSSHFFDIGMITCLETISGRMMSMKKILDYNEEVIRLEQEALDAKQEASLWKAKVAHLLGWEIEAEDMLLSGAKQNEVATKFNKSISTVKRLAKRLKDEGRL